MNKFFTVLLSVAIILSSSVYANASNVTDVALTSDCDIELASQLLKYIGTYDAETDAASSDSVTRQDFAEYIASLACISAWEQTKFCSDTDSPIVNTLVKMGYLNILEDGKFNPGNFIELDDALKICLNVLRFKDYINALGGRTTDYLNTARKIDLIGTSVQNRVLSQREVTILLYNTLLSKPFDDSSIIRDNGNVTYALKNETLLELLYDIQDDEGVVIANNITSLYRNVSSVSDGQINIDGMVYNFSDGAKYLGQNVVFFKTKNHGSSIERIVALAPQNDDSTENIYASDVEKTDNGITYTDKDGKSRKISVKNPLLIYNGVADYGALTTDILSLAQKNNSVTSVYRNSYDVYSTVVVIYNYDYFCISGYDRSNMKLLAESLFDKSAVTYDLNNADKIEILCDGSSVSDSYLKLDATIAVAQSKDKKALRIVVVDSTVTGSVSEIKYGSNVIVQINDKNYCLNDEFAKSDEAADISIGGSYKFRLDMLGDIVSVSKWGPGNGSILAYVYARKNPSGLETSPTYKIFTADGKTKEVTLKSKITLDGKRVTASDADSFLAPGKELKQQLLILKLNSDDMIASIDTALDTSDGVNSLNRIDNKKNRRYLEYKNVGTMMFYGETNTTYQYLNHPVCYDTLIFTVPDEDVNYAYAENFLSVSSFSDGNKPIIHDNYYTVDLYKYNADSSFADVCVLYKKAGDEPSATSPYYLVNETMNALDKNESPAVLLEVLDISNGAPYNITVEPQAFFRYGNRMKNNVTPSYVKCTDFSGVTDISDLVSSGDIIQLGTSETGNGDYVNMIFDFSENKAGYGFADESYSDYTYSFESSTITAYTNMEKSIKARFTYGTLYSLYNNMSFNRNIQYYANRSVYTVSDFNAPDTPAESYTFAEYWNRFVLYNSSRRTNNAYYGELQDAVPYSVSGAECAKVFTIMTNSGLLGSVFYIE